MTESLSGAIPLSRSRVALLETILSLLKNGRRVEAAKLLQENGLTVLELLHLLNSYYNIQKRQRVTRMREASSTSESRDELT